MEICLIIQLLVLWKPLRPKRLLIIIDKVLTFLIVVEYSAVVHCVLLRQTQRVNLLLGRQAGFLSR